VPFNPCNNTVYTLLLEPTYPFNYVQYWLQNRIVKLTGNKCAGKAASSFSLSHTKSVYRLLTVNSLFSSLVIYTISFSIKLNCHINLLFVYWSTRLPCIFTFHYLICLFICLSIAYLRHLFMCVLTSMPCCLCLPTYLSLSVYTTSVFVYLSIYPSTRTQIFPLLSYLSLDNI
jgi:hypothetical protein